MSFLQTVKETTRSKHELMEKLIGSERLEDFELTDYQLLISTNFIFHSHLEESASKFLSGEEHQKKLQKINFKQRIKTIALREELRHLIETTRLQAIEKVPNTIQILSYHSLLGRLYVAEGSMLGGKTIHHILAKNPKIERHTKFEFYEEYAKKTGRLWKSFKDLVEEECQHEKSKELFLEGVHQSYQYFEKSFHKAKNYLHVK